jgi:pimeloyl-ACP methyl ester carboxylesterase
MSAPRVYVIFGQGGSLFSGGMVSLAERMRRQGYDVVTDFSWKYPDKIVSDIRHTRRKDPDRKVALIGFSMGANCTTWVADSGVAIDLLVAYDPSAGLLWWKAYPPSVIAGNVKKAYCYQQVGPEIVGRGVIRGNVTVVETVSPHLFVQSDERLHDITLRALERL